MRDDGPATMARELRQLLVLTVPPIAPTFAAAAPEDVAPFGAAHPAPTADGRTGAVSASHVFWMHATERAFATLPADHGNCSVGSYTHGFRALAEVVGNDAVQALPGTGWVTPEAASAIPGLAGAPLRR
ncbi:MAG: hypothetical protein M0002_08515 [Rhodospirillales bacterium]|nr:hypothetical protein [Rhodospirillales bacterium]